jgi:hypothetical protein
VPECFAGRERVMSRRLMRRAKPDTIHCRSSRLQSAAPLRIASAAELAAWRLSHPKQPALFPLRADCRPQPERTATGSYQEPTLPQC